MSDKAEVTVIDGVPSVNIDKLKPESVPATLEWKLKNADGWTFAAIGISIDDGSPQFSNPTRKDNGKTFTWDDANTDGQEHEYTIHVQHASGQTASLDPTIVNKSVTVNS